MCHVASSHLPNLPIDDRQASDHQIGLQRDMNTVGKMLGMLHKDFNGGVKPAVSINLIRTGKVTHTYTEQCQHSKCPSPSPGTLCYWKSSNRPQSHMYKASYIVQIDANWICCGILKLHQLAQCHVMHHPWQWRDCPMDRASNYITVTPHHPPISLCVMFQSSIQMKVTNIAHS